MNYLIIKRLIDIISSLLLILILLPLGMVLGIAIKLDSPGGVIFAQNRLGRHGKVFSIYKFRSMNVGAEKGGVYETVGDPRVTVIGRLMRRTSIDELPQLINILKGDMSIIGPRPTLTYHPWPIEQYTPAQLQRFQVRPGITGLAQISGRKNLPWDKRIELDVWYVRNLSFILDIKIIFYTIIKIVTNEDNVSLVDTVDTRSRSGDSNPIKIIDDLAASKDECGAD